MAEKSKVQNGIFLLKKHNSAKQLGRKRCIDDGEMFVGEFALDEKQTSLVGSILSVCVGITRLSFVPPSNCIKEYAQISPGKGFDPAYYRSIKEAAMFVTWGPFY